MPSSIELGIDYGTTRLIIYDKDKGIVFDEPSSIAINSETKQILAIGQEAYDMIGRTPDTIIAKNVMYDLGTSNVDMASQLLRLAVAKVMKKKNLFSRPRALLALPTIVSDNLKVELIKTLADVGMKRTQLMHKGIATCLGAGIQIDRTRRMIVDISGSITEILIINNRLSQDSFSEYCSYHLDKKISGDSFSAAIINYFDRNHSMHISVNTAHKIKKEFATLYPPISAPKYEVWGRGKLTNMLDFIQLSKSEIAQSLLDTASILVSFIQAVINQLTPQESLDIHNKGIFLTGGGSLLNGLNTYISNNLGIKTIISATPQYDIALGLGYALENPHEVKEYLTYLKN